MQLGFLGFGKMGSRMVEKLLSDAHDVVGWNRSKEAISHFEFRISNFHYAKNFSAVSSLVELVSALQPPRIIWLMLPAGEATQTVLDELVSHLSPGDIVIDGGNAHFSDTETRSKGLGEKGIKYLGIGVSGGVHALVNGYPLMVGGDKDAYEAIIPILESLAKSSGGHAYFGTGGAGHFVKMVHNGIEYGMMQAIGEGFGVMDKSPYNLDLLEVAKLYQKKTIISGFLMDCTKDALSKDPKLSEIDGVIDSSGEAYWTITQADEEGIDVPVIRESFRYRTKSKEDKRVSDSFAAKLIAALRHEFGGHPLNPGHSEEKVK